GLQRIVPAVSAADRELLEGARSGDAARTAGLCPRVGQRLDTEGHRSAKRRGKKGAVHEPESPYFEGNSRRENESSCERHHPRTLVGLALDTAGHPPRRARSDRHEEGVR